MKFKFSYKDIVIGFKELGTRKYISSIRNVSLSKFHYCFVSFFLILCEPCKWNQLCLLQLSVFCIQVNAFCASTNICTWDCVLCLKIHWLLALQDVENNMCKSESRLTFVDDSSTAPLLSMTSVDLKERPWKSCSPSFGKTVLSSRPLVFAITAMAVCFGVCAVALHPSSVGEFTTTIRRCLFDNNS